MLLYIYIKNTKLCVDYMDTSLQVLVFHACTSMAISDPGPAYNGLCFQLSVRPYSGGSSCLPFITAGFLMQLHAHVLRKNIGNIIPWVTIQALLQPLLIKIVPNEAHAPS